MKQFDDVKFQKSFPELTIENALNESIVQESVQSSPALSPSNLGCPRSAAFKLAGSLTGTSVETYENGLPAAMGSFIHERIQKFLSLNDMWVDVNTFISENPTLGISVAEVQKHDGETSLVFSGIRKGKKISPPFHFQCDGIVRIKGEYYIVEIKTETERAWENRVAPNPKHSKQAVAYSFLYGIDKVLWIYASRESFGTHRKIYLQQVNTVQIEGLKNLVQQIGTAVEKDDIKSLPKVKDCTYCAYKELCKDLK